MGGSGNIVRSAGACSFQGLDSHAAGRRRAARALVLPSVHECGGAVVLEAMCLGLPVVATDWGGPADYLDDSCGILVPPTTRDALVSGFADAMRELATNPTLRKTLGDQGLRRIHEHYDWERKLDRMLEIYRETIERSNTH